MIKRLLKDLILRLDRGTNIGLRARAIRFQEFWFRNRFLNCVRRRWGPFVTRLRYLLLRKPARPLKLLLGCGDIKIDGYINIDWRRTRATDLVCDITKLPYPNGSVERIEIYHVIEHLSVRVFEKALGHWHAILVEGGRLVIECPDFDATLREYLDGKEERIHNIFGLHRFDGDAHHFGYSLGRLKKILEAAGFRSIERREPTDYHKHEEPCFRVECVKG